MSDEYMSNRVHMHWVTVPDGHGGLRLEARWIEPTPAASVVTHAA